MKIRKLLAAALALVMVFALVPVVSLAEGVGSVVDEASAMSKLDSVWAVIESVEADAIAAGMPRDKVINAVHEAALNIGSVDADSFSDFTKDGFFFTVNGMYCSYDYRLRNELAAATTQAEPGIFVVKGSGNGTTVADAESPNVLLVAPYYGHDGSFTNQYKEEAQSIAEATGGDYTLIQSTAATGPAIVENYIDKGVVIYDSHGTQSGTSSYLCLTTNAGITQQDYQNGWAVNAGNAAYIDGRYVENHVTATLSNPIVWMAICEGMMRSGQGTTGYALMRAGAGCVYGYSQSVTFRGDYVYEATFWDHMKEGETVAEAYNAMVAAHGIPDPYGDAYPIVMSPTDDFPANPDAAQVVTCDWILFGNAEPVALTNFSLSEPDVSMYIGESASVEFVRVPENANQYELTWTSANTSIATVTGNNRRANINGLSVGNTVVTCTVHVDGQVFGTATVYVAVEEDTTLRDALNVPGGQLSFGTSAEHSFTAVQSGDRYFARSGNQGVANSASSLTTNINMQAGETLTFEYAYSSENNYDWYNFTVNGEQIHHLSGTSNSGWQSYTFTAPSNGAYTFIWSFTKDISMNSGEDCCKIDNVEYSGSVEPQPGQADGDLDGDGETTVNDGLIALRIAMGLLNPSGDQTLHGDLDGDGVISVNEALRILRIALGL